ncbi:methionine--tRNA ligase [Candidatus Zixiibacteriota bacterium]
MAANPANPERVLVTTPIYYVNDRPHLGHAYTTVAADFMARAHRLLGREVFFLTGTDEHGEKVAETARARGMTPMKHCDEVVAGFQEAWKALSINYDRFIRTTEQAHVQGVEKLLKRLHEVTGPDGKPVVYEGEYRGLYCTGCEKFLSGRDIEDGKCPVHPTRDPQEITERNYFFRLSAFLEQLKAKIENDDIRIRPAGRKREVLGLFAQGLDDFSISREKVEWGIPLPFDQSQTAYVWVDALSNYITGIGFGDEPESYAKWWNNSLVLHLMAKDILKFHTIFWPAMLMAVGEKTPDEMFIHGYLTLVDRKMSKSLGNVIKPDAWVKDFGIDGARYLLTTVFRFGQDGEIREDMLSEKYDADLANDFGNLVSRVSKMIMKHFDGFLPEPDYSGPEEQALKTATADAERKFAEAIDHVDPNHAVDAALSIAREANRYFDHAAPWKLVKEKQTDKLAAVLGVTIEAVFACAVCLSPVLPNKIPEVLRSLGFTEAEIDARLKTGQSIAAPAGRQSINAPPFFPRTDKRKEKAEPEPKEKPKTDGIITIDEFFTSKLKTAEVIAAERVEKADKLLKLQIQVGEENRQIVAGIAEFYQPEDLVGRTIVVVTNLKPAKIRGVESNGMLLAARHGKTLRLVTTDGEIPSGSDIG